MRSKQSKRVVVSRRADRGTLVRSSDIRSNGDVAKDDDDDANDDAHARASLANELVEWAIGVVAR